MAREFRYEIKEHIATLSEERGYALEVNLISYGGAEPRVDIRKWDKEKGQMLKGVTMNRAEAAALLEALKGMERKE